MTYILVFVLFYRINELADLQNENVKLRNSLYQKEEKILDLTDRSVFSVYLVIFLRFCRRKSLSL